MTNKQVNVIVFALFSIGLLISGSILKVGGADQESLANVLFYGGLICFVIGVFSLPD